MRLQSSVLKLALALMIVSSLAALAQEFSAEMINLKNPGDSDHGKMYVEKNKMRFEGMQGPRWGSVSMIVNLADQESYILIPERKMYIENVAGMGPQHRDLQYFQVQDAMDACEQWKKMATEPGGSCKKI